MDDTLWLLLHFIWNGTVPRLPCQQLVVDWWRPQRGGFQMRHLGGEGEYKSVERLNYASVPLYITSICRWWGHLVVQPWKRIKSLPGENEEISVFAEGGAKTVVYIRGVQSKRKTGLKVGSGGKKTGRTCGRHLSTTLEANDLPDMGTTISTGNSKAFVLSRVLIFLQFFILKST